MKARGKRRLMLAVALLLVVAVVVMAATVGRRRRKTRGSQGDFAQRYDITWAPDHVRLGEGGRLVELVLDQSSGAGFGSKARYLFGYISMQIRLVPNNSAGIAVAYYMSSLTDDRDELSFVFLGNASGQPYSVETNIFFNGIGGRQQRFLLWFDPSQDFHTYSVLWNQHQIVFLVDTVPIRVFSNPEGGGPYPLSKPLGIYTSLWKGGAIDWSAGPFVVSYTGLASGDACECPNDRGSCQHTSGRWWESLMWPWEVHQASNLTTVRAKYMVYDYCTTGQAALHDALSVPECKQL